jgi:hypothetical protein
MIWRVQVEILKKWEFLEQPRIIQEERMMVEEEQRRIRLEEEQRLED